MSKTRSKILPIVGRRSIKDVSSKTSDFTENDVRFLNIQYQDTHSLFPIPPRMDDMITYEYLLLKNMYYTNLINIKEINTDNSSSPNEMRKIMSVVDYMSSVLEITEETVTNDFVSFLLSELQLNLRPFKLRHERKYIIHLSGMDIISIPDMSVEDHSTILLVDEDKSLFNVDHASNWGENQIAGEIFTALYRNYSNHPDHCGINNPVYAMRVIGTFFTFYKATASKDYLRAASQQELEEEYDEFGRRHIHLSKELVITRYPPNTVKHLDHIITTRRNYVGLNYLDVNERKQIVSLLLSLKATLEDMETKFFF